MSHARGSSPAGPHRMVNGGLRRLDGGRTHRPPEKREVEEARGSYVGADGGASSAGGDACDPAQHRRGEKRHDQCADCQAAAKRRQTASGDRRGRRGRCHNRIERVRLTTPERLGARRDGALLRAASERNQLLAWTEPVARKWHYVVVGPRLLAALLAIPAFRVHPVAASLYRICRSFPPNRDGFCPPGPVVYPSELVPVCLN
jgi:hypothetical protein